LIDTAARPAREGEAPAVRGPQTSQRSQSVKDRKGQIPIGFLCFFATFDVFVIPGERLGRSLALPNMIHHMHTATTPTTSAASPAVSVRGVRREFPGPVLAIDRVDLEVRAGEFVAILGPSGCGKSTLLRIIAGLDRAGAGEVRVCEKSKIAYVFQDAHLLPWRNVLRSVELPLELAGATRTRRRDAALIAIEQVGLTDAMTRYPAQLSGGMRMRVSLARALVTNPQLLLLDEPFAALDEITRAALDQQLRRLWIDRRMTVLFVTHSITEAAFLADRAIVMSRRPGRVVVDTPIELGRERPNQLRGEPEFARYTKILLDALARGGA
jgi:NitT/TauT family transport system ATP-binding protein